MSCIIMITNKKNKRRFANSKKQIQMQNYEMVAKTLALSRETVWRRERRVNDFGRLANAG